MNWTKLLFFIALLFLQWQLQAQELPQAAIVRTDKTAIDKEDITKDKVEAFYAPESELIVVQIKGLLRKDLTVNLFDQKFQLLQEKRINSGSTLTYLDTATLYDGNYLVQISDGKRIINQQISLVK